MGSYFAAYLIPLSAAIGLWAGGAWSWLTVGLVYGVVPLLDQAVGRSAANLDETAQAAAAPTSPFRSARVSAPRIRKDSSIAIAKARIS